MSNKPRKRSAAALATGAALVLGVGVAGAAAPGTSKGPTTTVDPYVIPLDAAKVQIASLLTVDDLAAGGYPMVGIPDGLGAYVDGSNVVLLSNHELGSTVGAVRANGQKGAFVSKFTIDPATKAFTAGADLIPNAAALDYSGTPATAFARFCSGDLSTASSFYNTATSTGYDGSLYFAGEENGPEGRLVGHDPLTGNAKVLLAPGLTSWENAVAANTSTSNTTLVMGNNDTAGGINFVYVGAKQNTGSIWDKAGLTNGAIFGYKVDGTVSVSTVNTDALFRTTYGKGVAVPFSLTTALTGATGAAQQLDGKAKGALQLDRTEDGAWNPSSPNDYYFVTTGSTAKTATGGRGGLWKMHFTDRTNPSLGGTLTLLLDANEAAPMYMPDNMTIDGAGHIVLLEDPGADNYVARVFAYDIATATLAPIATFDNRFVPGDPSFITNDEESSGVIPAPASFGANTFLFDAQVHSATNLSNATAQVERGQYMSMTVDFSKVFPAAPVDVPEVPMNVLLPLSAAAVGGAAILLQRRRRTVQR